MSHGPWAAAAGGTSAGGRRPFVLVDRQALVAAFVGIGMAVTIGISFLLVIPIEPIYWILSVPAGLLIGYYANTRAARGRGDWLPILGNGIVSGLATGLTLAVLLLAVKGLFFVADDGYRDADAGGRLSCQTGADCVYQRYLPSQGDALRAAGVTDAASFSTFYWNQQLGTAGALVAAST
ncbi:MAG TPA: hypothetical protein VFW86_06650, partial [Candidatus Limnocylindrales bacterium]|nr:hypothetical protein [Candidatus Limnocylindrales bacterium]